MSTQTAVRKKSVELPSLKVATPLAVQQELKLDGSQSVAPENVDPALQQMADQWTDQLLDFKLEDFKARQDRSTAVETLGAPEQQLARRSHQLLQMPLKRLKEIGDDGGKMATDLVELKVQFDSVDPARFNFEPGFIGRVFGGLPFVGRPINRFFTRFEASGNVIDALFQSLEVSKSQLLRDIDTLKDEGLRMRELTLNLQKVILVAHLVRKRIEKKVEEMPDGDEKKFVQEELLFPLLQRVSDLEQQLVVNQQGIITFEVIVRNDKELVRGIERCWNVTRPALEIGVTAAVALANQKIAIGKIESVDRAGEKFIEFNARILRQQGVEIHKKAASAKLSDSILASAIRESVAALEDVSNFRIQAIKQMSEAIDNRQKMLAEAEGAIQRMERGNEARPALMLTLSKDLKSPQATKS